MSQSIFLDDIGVKIILSVDADISTSTIRKIKYRKPNGVTGSWTAIQESTTSISYTTTTGDINVKGAWSLQAYIETPGWTLHGAITRLIVKAVL